MITHWLVFLRWILIEWKCLGGKNKNSDIASSHFLFLSLNRQPIHIFSSGSYFFRMLHAICIFEISSPHFITNESPIYYVEYVCVCSHKNGIKWIWKHEEMRLKVDTAKRLMSLSLSLSFFFIFCLRKHTQYHHAADACWLTTIESKQEKNTAHTVSIILNTISIYNLEQKLCVLCELANAKK